MSEALIGKLRHEIDYAESHGFQRSTIWLSREDTDAICDAFKAQSENDQLRAQLSAALARGERLEKALAFYADDQNYRMNGPLDPNSSWFDGNNRARAALAAEGKE